MGGRIGRPPVDPEAAFWAKVDRSGGPDACWPWTGARLWSGHGTFKSTTVGKQTASHRWAWYFTYGTWPGNQIDHACHTRDETCRLAGRCSHRACCNPAHLEVVTQRENVRRGRGRVAEHMVATECPKGHPYDEMNTYHRPKGGRGCRTCRAQASREWQARQRAVVGAP